MSENRVKSLELTLKIFCNPFDPCPGGKDRLPWNERTFKDLLSVADIFYNYLENQSDHSIDVPESNNVSAVVNSLPFSQKITEAFI